MTPPDSPAAIAWDAPGPHLLDIRVSEREIDLMQHTNNVHYLQWLENVAWDHSVHLGLAPADYARLGHGMVVRRHELDYLKPTYLGDTVRLATWIVGADRLSLRRRYQFVRLATGETVFRGATHFVCVEIAGGQVRRMPAEFQQVYQGAVTDWITP